MAVTSSSTQESQTTKGEGGPLRASGISPRVQGINSLLLMNLALSKVQKARYHAQPQVKATQLYSKRIQESTGTWKLSCWWWWGGGLEGAQVTDMGQLWMTERLNNMWS